MYRLRDWSMEICNGDVLCFGDCYGNPQFFDGDWIHTSRVMEVKIDSASKAVHARTYSGSHYVMCFADIRRESANEISDAMHRLGENLDINECLALKEQAAQISKQAITGVLKAGEMYVKMAGGNSAKEAYFQTEKGVLVEIPVSVHVGTFKDSVLIRKGRSLDFRFFPSPISVQPYTWSKGIAAIYLENMGSDFMFKGTHRDILCRQGVVTCIRREEYQEGVG